MTATMKDIKVWLDQAKQNGATHLIVALDRFDHENYPVFVMLGQDIDETLSPYRSGENMQGYDEVYSLTGKHSIESQLAERRAQHLD